MGQVIPFRARRVDRTAGALQQADAAFLDATRRWAASFRARQDPLPGLRRHLHPLGAAEAAFSVNALMEIVARTLRRPIDIHCPGCSCLSPDERRLLDAAALAQAGDHERAERALRSALLSAQGAEFALGPLAGLGRLFARAGLMFAHRNFALARLRPGIGAAPPRDHVN